jgi:tetratricopeptide (TPR) repeat protein
MPSLDSLAHASLRAVALTVCVVSASAAQPAPGVTRWVDSTRVLIDAGLRTNQLDRIDAAIALLDRVLTVIPSDAVLLHYRGYALYRRSNLLNTGGKEADVRAALDEAVVSLMTSAQTLDWPETQAVLASVYGQLIGLSPGPITAMRLGPRSDAAMERAMELGKDNPRVFLLRGIGSIFKPRLFGGGLDKAERDIRRALELFPTDKPASPAPSWGHAEAWAWLGQVLVREERPQEARAAYLKALEIEPEFGWVKYQLLPALDRK